MVEPLRSPPCGSLPRARRVVNLRALPVRITSGCTMRMDAVLLSAVLLCIALVPRALQAQSTAGGGDAVETESGISADSAATSPTAGIRFERNVNTLVWDLRGSWLWRDGGGWSGSIDERFVRTLIESSTPNVRDDQTLALTLRRRLGAGFEAVVRSSSFLFSDDRSVGLSNLATHRVLGGIAWSPWSALLLQPMAGWSYDMQQGVRDNGFAWGADALLSPLALGSTSVAASASLLREQLTPRAISEHRATVGILSPLGEAGANRLSGSWRESGRDFYLAFDSSLFSRFGVEHPIESRTERVLSVADQIEVEFERRFFMRGGIEASSRSVRKRQRYRVPESTTPVFDSHLDEFRIGMQGQLRYESRGGLRSELRAEYGEREETYGVDRHAGANDIAWLRQQRLEDGKNNSIAQTQLEASLLVPVTNDDTLSAAFSTVKLVYDTPAESNVDDRDELVMIGALRWMRRMSPVLTVHAAADMSLRHTVYIFAERSANNTWNRVLRLSPGLELRLPGFITRLHSEVTANYTVYDFEALNPTLTSYALRQLAVADTMLVRVAGRIWIDARLHLRIYERGQLFWNSFRLRPLSSFDERSVALMLTWDGETIAASTGLRLFHQTRYTYDKAEWREDGTLESLGPACTLRMRQGALELRAEGWYQITRQSGAGTITTPNISMGIAWQP